MRKVIDWKIKLPDVVFESTLFRPLVGPWKVWIHYHFNTFCLRSGIIKEHSPVFQNFYCYANFTVMRVHYEFYHFLTRQLEDASFEPKSRTSA